MSSDIIKITDGKTVIEVTERVFEVIYADRGWGKLEEETEAETEAKKETEAETEAKKETEAETEAKKAPAKTKGK